jgi:hypothetical protein
MQRGVATGGGELGLALLPHQRGVLFKFLRSDMVDWRKKVLRSSDLLIESRPGALMSRIRFRSS